MSSFLLSLDSYLFSSSVFTQIWLFILRRHLAEQTHLIVFSRTRRSKWRVRLGAATVLPVRLLLRQRLKPAKRPMSSGSRNPPGIFNLSNILHLHTGNCPSGVSVAENRHHLTLSALHLRGAGPLTAGDCLLLNK